MILAINQPYFSPYSGYYSLINSADIFIFFDSVQFTRRGRIHRSQIHPSDNFQDGWLTLPLQKMPQQALIKDMVLNPVTLDLYNQIYAKLIRLLDDEFDMTPFRVGETLLCDFLYLHLQTTLKKLGIETKVIRSSTLDIPEDLTGQDRIIEICKLLGARTYLNANGGRALYKKEDFAAHDLDLQFIETSTCSRLGYLQAIAERQLQLFINESQADLRD